MEMEDTESPLGEWIFKTSHDNGDGTTSLTNHRGSGYLEFNGNEFVGGPVNSPLEFKFKVNMDGYYYLHLRCAKEHLDVGDGDGIRTDIANDGFIRVNGDYGSGPNPGDAHTYDAPLSILQSDTKFFGGKDLRWDWATGNRIDPGGHDNKRVAIYYFKAGEYYTFVISGRSKAFKVDRIVFRHESVASNYAENNSRRVSEIIPDGLAPTEKVYKALVDFTDDSNYANDNNRNALKVRNNAGTEYASAFTVFNEAPGIYDLSITALRSTNGQSTYEFLLNNVLIGSRTNESTALNYEPQQHVFYGIPLEAGDSLTVRSNRASNNGGLDYSQGRWTQLELTLRESGVFNLSPSVDAGADKNITLPGNSTSLVATASDLDGAISSYLWEQTAGPNSSQLDGEDTANLTVNGLVEGSYTFQITVTDNEGLTAFDTVDVNVVSKTAFGNGGNAWPIPGRIEAENFDTGGEGVAYSDIDQGNNGSSSYRDGENVDIQPIEGSSNGEINVGWTIDGEWLEYTVNVSEAGTYVVDVRMAAQNDGGTVRFLSDSVDKTGAIDFLTTGGWQTYTVVTSPEFLLESGEQTVRLELTTGGSNLDWIEFRRVTQSYTDFIATYPALTGDDALPEADPDNDGISSLIEQWLNMDPTIFDLDKLPGLTLIDGNMHYRFTYDSAVTGSTLVYQTSVDLNIWETHPMQSDWITEDGDLRHVDAVFDLSEESKVFHRLKVE